MTSDPSTKEVVQTWKRIMALQQNGPYMVAINTILQTIAALETSPSVLDELKAKVEANIERVIRLSHEAIADSKFELAEYYAAERQAFDEVVAEIEAAKVKEEEGTK